MHTNPSSTIQKTPQSTLLTRCLQYKDPHFTHLNWYQNNQLSPDRTRQFLTCRQLLHSSPKLFTPSHQMIWKSGISLITRLLCLKSLSNMPLYLTVKYSSSHCFPISKAPDFHLVTIPILNPRISNFNNNFSKSDSPGDTEVVARAVVASV